MEQNNEKELEQAKENLKLMLESQANVKYDVVGPICESTDKFTTLKN